jgi:hypothetical protein
VAQAWVGCYGPDTTTLRPFPRSLSTQIQSKPRRGRSLQRKRTTTRRTRRRTRTRTKTTMTIVTTRMMAVPSRKHKATCWAKTGSLGPESATKPPMRPPPRPTIHLRREAASRAAAAAAARRRATATWPQSTRAKQKAWRLLPEPSARSRSEPWTAARSPLLSEKEVPPSR